MHVKITWDVYTTQNFHRSLSHPHYLNHMYKTRKSVWCDFVQFRRIIVRFTIGWLCKVSFGSPRYSGKTYQFWEVHVVPFWWTWFSNYCENLLVVKIDYQSYIWLKVSNINYVLFASIKKNVSIVLHVYYDLPNYWVSYWIIGSECKVNWHFFSVLSQLHCWMNFGIQKQNWTASNQCNCLSMNSNGFKLDDIPYITLNSVIPSLSWWF